MKTNRLDVTLYLYLFLGLLASQFLISALTDVPQEMLNENQDLVLTPNQKETGILLEEQKTVIFNDVAHLVAVCLDKNRDPELARYISVDGSIKSTQIRNVPLRYFVHEIVQRLEPFHEFDHACTSLKTVADATSAFTVLNVLRKLEPELPSQLVHEVRKKGTSALFALNYRCKLNN